MSDLICPFHATLVKVDFGCQYADQVVRRGGAEIACTAASEHQHCSRFYQRVKLEALATMGLEDDLLSLPHSVLVKIQFGSLLAMQTEIANSPIENIAALMTMINEKYPDHDALPFQDINAAISHYKLSRRGSRPDN